MEKLKMTETMNPARDEKKYVLIADDDEPLTSTMAEALRRNGMAAATANRGEDALRIARNTQPDVILLGDRLRDGMGYDFCRKLKAGANTAHIPLIMIANAGGIEDRLAGYLAGAQCYICKPIGIREMAERIDFFLEKKTIPEDRPRPRSSESAA